MCQPSSGCWGYMCGQNAPSISAMNRRESPCPQGVSFRGIVTPIFYRKKLTYKEVKALAQGHTVDK